MSKLYFVSARSVGEFSNYDISVVAKLEKLLRKFNLSRYIAKGDYVAVKIHFGSTGGHRTIRPVFVRKIVDAVKQAGGKPFVCDTVRIEGYEYLEVANQNGYNYSTLGCPVILADGLFGRNCVRVKAGELMGEIGIASEIFDADAMVVVTHCKGHIGAGFGGSIKNISMGAISSKNREGKAERGRVHAEERIVVEWIKENCKLCGECVKICDHNAIRIYKKEVVINNDLCAKCGRCAKTCPNNALLLPVPEERFQRGMVEAAKATLSTFKKKKVVYINFLMEVMPHCDCHLHSDVPIINDQGILIGDDIVAIDYASINLIENSKPLPDSAAEGLKPGKGLFKKIVKRDGYIHIIESAKQGLGSLEYEVVDIEGEIGTFKVDR